MEQRKVYNNLKAVEETLKSSSYNIEDYKRILNKIDDEKSKLMFYYKVMFDNTNDAYYALLLEKAMYYSSTFYSLADKITYNFLDYMLKNENYKKNIYIIGFPYEDMQTNIWYTMTYFYHRIEGLSVECIFDNNNNNESYFFDCIYPIKVHSLKKLESYNFKENSIFIIANPNLYYIKDYLNNHLNISNDNIFVFEVRQVCVKDIQYLYESFINIGENEVLIDGGAADFDTTTRFLECVNSAYKKIFVFEPLKEYYDICINKINQFNLNNIVVKNVGLWKEDGIVSFKFKDYGSSCIDDNGNDSINVRSIDSVLNGEEATIIKMDIEGAEYEALEGAKNTIINYKPVLMVCVYHKPNDVFRLANLILSMNPEYHIFVRHYSFSICETVMYFVPENKLNKFL